MPTERRSTTVKFYIGGQKGHLTVGFDEDGNPKEIFIHDVGKLGSTMQGMADAWATTISILMQYGMPVEDIVRSFIHVKFEPSGMTNDPEIPKANSIVDYVVRYLASRFLDDDQREFVGIQKTPVTVVEVVCPGCRGLMTKGRDAWMCSCGRRVDVSA